MNDQKSTTQPTQPGATGMTRRELLGAASLTAAGIAIAGLAAAPEARAIPHKGAHHDPLENFKYDIEKSEGWSGEGGSAYEATVEEFPVSQSIAGVSMRLKPGGLRELHWHAIAAEWAYVIKGNVRTTVITPSGQAEQDDFGPGDVWFFPKGHGHALQSLGPEEAHFLLGFDDGHFSEFGTFSITDWFNKTHPEVLARNTGLSPETLAKLPKGEMYIGQGKVPPKNMAPLRHDTGSSQMTHKYRLAAAKPTIFPGGEQRVVSQKEFPIQTTLTGVLMDLKPGALREMHWHPNADEWQYYVSGRARVTIFGAHGRAATEEFGPGQICFIKQGFGHYVEQIGDEPTQIVILFNHPAYEEISLSTWLAGNPAQMLADNFGLDHNQIDKLPTQTIGIASKQS